MQAWEEFITTLESEIGKEPVDKWVRPLKILHFDACNLYLEAKDTFQIMWFEEHIRHKVLTRLVNNNRRKIKVHLSISNVPAKVKKREPKTQKNLETAPAGFTLDFDAVDPHCTLSTFVVSDANELTYRVFAEMIEARGCSITPIYVHGPTGAGKTHLLMAVAVALRKKGLHVIYVRAQSFTDHLLAAIRTGEMSAFRQMYRNGDVIIIDDVHLFSRKAATQEEFFHTFNTLHVAGKKIILSANSSPRELQFIEPRLVSRFEWGITLTLDLPPRDKMEEILQERIRALDFPLHAKVVEFLLNSFSSSTSLYKALEALVLRSHLNQRTHKGPSSHLTVAVVQQMLSDLLQEQQEAALTPSHIIQHIAEHFGIKTEDIVGKAQTRDCVLPRQIAMYFCRNELALPYVKIGEFFSRDHSTVMSSVKQIQKGMESDDQEIAAPCRSIMKKLKG